MFRTTLTCRADGATHIPALRVVLHHCSKWWLWATSRRGWFSGDRRVVSFWAARPEGFGTLDEAAEVIAAYNPHRARLDNGNRAVRRDQQSADRWCRSPTRAAALSGPMVKASDFSRGEAGNRTLPVEVCLPTSAILYDTGSCRVWVRTLRQKRSKPNFGCVPRAPITSKTPLLMSRAAVVANALTPETLTISSPRSSE
jgi:hypothetical protein